MTMRINSDFSPDLYDEQTHLRDQIDNLHENIAHRDGDLRSYEYRVKERDTQINELKLTIGEREHSIKVDARITQQLINTRDDLIEERDELAEGVNTFKADMERFHDQLVEEREAHVHEINQLKAQMFDMIAKSEQFELTKNWGTGGV